jgi:hypothetical protein
VLSETIQDTVQDIDQKLQECK